MMILFGAVTGVIYSGTATPTEASAIGATGALFLALVKGKLGPAQLRRCLVRAAHGTCMIAAILVGASLFSTFFTLTHVTQDLIGWVGALPTSRWVIIALILAGYVVLGSLMDQIAILVLTVPVVVPLIKSLGFDPIWVRRGEDRHRRGRDDHAAVGLNCFVVARYSGRPVSEVFHGTFPHFIAHLLIIAVFVAFPDLVLWLPRHMSGR